MQTTPICNVIKMLKTKTKGKSYSRRTNHTKKTPIRLTSDFLSEVVETRRQWNDISSTQTKTVSQEPLASKTILQKRRQNKDIPT